MVNRVALLCLCLSNSAVGATLRPFVSLSEPVVRLSDLFEHAGPDLPLGPAPAPGGRIVVESAQLAAIARQFGVDWRPSSAADRAILDRPGRALVREDVADALRGALLQAGMARDAELELPALTGPLMPVEAAVRVEVAQLDLDASTGRFTAMLNVVAGMAPSTPVRVSGRAMAMTDLPVPRRRLLAGEIVAATDLEWSRLRSGQARGELVRDPQEAVGMALRRTLQPGQPMPVEALGRPVVVRKGMPMLLSLDSPGIQLTAQGIAMEPAGLGERVRVQNPLSRVVVEAEVTGPGRGRVVPINMPAPVRQAGVR